MTQERYRKAVLRFGGETPWIDENGDPVYCTKESFGPDDVTTDGKGNVVDVPLMRRRPCFGRPETFFRWGFWQQTTTTAADTPKTYGKRCYDCPVRPACKKVCDERVKSHPEIAAAFTHWFKSTVGLAPMMRFAAHVGGEAWTAFLDKIIAFGGWTNSNDAAAMFDQRRRYEADRKSRNETKKQRRAEERVDRFAKVRQVSQEFIDAAYAERDRRFAELPALKAAKGAPQMLIQLSPRGCRMLVDVWLAKTLMERAGEKMTARSIAEWMAGKNLGPVRAPVDDSTATQISRVLRRIRELEDDRSGAAVWPSFIP